MVWRVMALYSSSSRRQPELRAYLGQLLADAERLTAARELAEWARATAMPSPEEIETLRRLIIANEEVLRRARRTRPPACAGRHHHRPAQPGDPRGDLPGSVPWPSPPGQPHPVPHYRTLS